MVDTKKEGAGAIGGLVGGAIGGPAGAVIGREVAETLYDGLSKPWEMDPTAFWPLFSSNLEAFAYNKDTQELKIRFKGDRTYLYPGVEESSVQALSSASSPGGWWHANLKRAPFERLS